MTRASADVEIGQRFGERFVILEEVARGGMGVVYRARDERDGDDAALKVLGRASGSALARFDREATLLAQLNHAHVVHYRAHGREGDCPWLAMDWLEGVSLAEALDDGALEMSEVGALALAVCRGLAATHERGVVHRDLKPSNVFLLHGDPERAILLDFGVAQVVDATRLTDTGATLGTPAYMAPEQARGSRDVDLRADLYALGAVLFECLAGRPPFVGSTSFAVLAKRLLEDAPPVASVVGGVSPSLARVVDALLQRAPAARPSHAREVAELLKAASFEPVSVVPKLRGPPVGAASTERRVGSVLLAGSGGDQTLTASDARVDHDALRRIASSHGATVQLASSDAVMLTFAKAANATDSASAAARCGLALRAVWPERGVAVATGHLVLGPGAIEGDAVDRAAALLRRGMGIGIDETTRALLGAHFIIEPQDDGWRLKAERPGPVLPNDGPPLTGRRRELRRLLRAHEDVVEDERPAVVIVTGEAGMGKSRLAAEALECLRASHPQLQVAVATGRPAHRDVPYGVAAQLVRDYASLQRGAAETFLEAWASPHGSSGRDPALLQHRLGQAFETWLGAAAESPLLLVLEDLHWTDRPSLELLDQSLATVSERPVMVVAIGRPELYARFGDGFRAHDRVDLRLAPLKADAGRALLQEVGVDAQAIGPILALADGNPFALLEIGRAEGRHQGRLPGTVLAAAQARLDALSPGARKAARAASVFGRRFEPSGVAAVLGTPPGRVAPWLDELAIAELVSRDGRRLSFAHDLLVEATYATLVRDDRRAAHGAAARFLDGRADVEPEEIFRHYRDGGEPRRAARWSMRAAERALALGDLARALSLSSPSPDADEETAGRLELVAGEVHLWQGRPDQASEHGRRALARLPAASVHGFRAAGLLFESSRGRASSDALLTLVDDCAQAAPDPSAETDRWLALARGVQCAIRAGDYERAERALERLSALPVPEHLAGHLEVVRGMRHLHRGEVAEWRFRVEKAREAFTMVGDMRNACWMRGEIGFAALEQGAYDDAEAMLGPALEEARSLGLDHVEAWLLLLRGPVLARVHSLEAGMATAREAVSALAALTDPRLEGAAHAYLGALLLEAGELEEAGREAEAAADMLEPHAPLVPLAAGLRARIAVARGEASLGLEHARIGRAVIDELGGVEEGEPQVDLAWVEALVALDRKAEAFDVAQAAVARLETRAEALTEEARPSFLAIPIHRALLDYASSKRLMSR